MSEEDPPKRWWQTLGALLSGIGTLLVGIGAVMGFFFGSHHAENEARQQSPAPAVSPQTTSNTPSSAASGAARRSAAERSAADRPRVLKTSTPDLPEPPEPVLTRQPYFLALPDKREYELRGSFDRAIYMLLKAKIIPQTPESDLLRVSVRVISRNRNQRTIRMYPTMFHLSTEDQRFDAETFNEDVPAGQSRDVNVDFYIPANLRLAKLKMELSNAQFEVPLNVAPAAFGEETLQSGSAR